jgi:hypothetical protein
MGAEFDYFRTKTSDRKLLLKEYESLVDDSRYENGHGGYTGTFAESPGLTVRGEVFTNEDDAEEFLLNKARKWDDTLAVLVRPEGGGDPYYVMGGWFSS